MLIVTPLPPALLPTGVRRRLEHHLDALTNDAPIVKYLFDDEVRSARQTISQARTRIRGQFGDVDEDVLLIGLGSLGMLVAAHEFARRGARVTFDQCDSAIEQALADIRGFTFKRPGVLGKIAMRLALIRSLDRRVDFTYISAADGRRDRVLIAGRQWRVVGPLAPPDLATLPTVNLNDLERVVVPADFASSHLRVGLDMLWQAVQPDTPIDIDLYGPIPPAINLPHVTYRGYAENLRDVYAGNTVVFVANVRGAGVANKLVEASASGRPVIAHPSAVERLGRPVQGWLYRDSRELRRILQEIAAGGAPSSI